MEDARNVLPLIDGKWIDSFIDKVVAEATASWRALKFAVFNMDGHGFEATVLHREQDRITLSIHLILLRKVSSEPEFDREAIGLLNHDVHVQSSSLAVEIHHIVDWVGA